MAFTIAAISSRRFNILFSRSLSGKAHRNPLTGKYEQTSDQKQAIDWARSQYHKASLPVDSFAVSYSRSGGPGGQNVNKVATKVEMRFIVDKADWIPAYVKERLRTDCTAKGEYVISSSRHRTQHQNYQDCLDKLDERIKTIIDGIPSGTSSEKSNRVQQLKKSGDSARLKDKRFQSSKKSERKAGKRDI